MTTPLFVTFTNARTGETERVNVHDVSRLEVGSVDDGALAAYTSTTLIHLRSGDVALVNGAVATTQTTLGAIVALGWTRLYNVTPTAAIALALMGTDAASDAGTWYYSEGVNDFERTVTNLSVLNGTTVGTDLVSYAIWGADGSVLGWTALAGALSAVADVYQALALVTPITLPPGRYFVGFRCEGTTAAHQTMPAGYTLTTGEQASTFGEAVEALSPLASTFTAGKGPFHLLT
jgi:hypothetical protein